MKLGERGDTSRGRDAVGVRGFVVKVLLPAPRSGKPPQVDEYDDRLCDTELFQAVPSMITLSGTNRHFTHDNTLSLLGASGLFGKARSGPGLGECT